jgi:hypothetical protein
MQGLILKKRKLTLSAVAHACNPSYEAVIKRISVWYQSQQVNETSISTKSQVFWHVPVISAMQEADIGRTEVPGQLR